MNAASSHTIVSGLIYGGNVNIFFCSLYDESNIPGKTRLIFWQNQTPAENMSQFEESQITWLGADVQTSMNQNSLKAESAKPLLQIQKITGTETRANLKQNFTHFTHLLRL